MPSPRESDRNTFCVWKPSPATGTVPNCTNPPRISRQVSQVDSVTASSNRKPRTMTTFTEISTLSESYTLPPTRSGTSVSRKIAMPSTRIIHRSSPVGTCPSAAVSNGTAALEAR